MISRQLARLVWVDATAGVPLIFGLINLTVTASITGLAGGEAMSGGMGDPLNLLLTASMYTTAICLGGAIAHSGSVVRKGLVDVAAATGRGRWAPIRIAMAASVCWAVFVQLAGLAIVSVRAAPGHSSPWTLTLGALSLLLSVGAAALGSVLGVRIVTAPAAAVAALATLTWFYGFTYASGSLRKLSPVYPEVFYSASAVEPNHSLVLGQILCSLGAGVTALAFVLSRRLWRWSGAVVGVSALLLGLAFVKVAPDGAAQYRFEDNPTCKSGASTKLCVFPEYAQRLDENLGVLERLRGAVSPYLETPESYRQLGLPNDGISVSFSGVYDDDSEARLSAAAEAVLPQQSCVDDAQASSAAVELQRWALALSGSPDTYAEGPDYTRYTPQESREFVAERLEILRRTC